MWSEKYRWNYDYVRLAWDTGFCFERHKSSSLDKSKISLLDIDRIINDRDVGSIERNIPMLVQFSLDDEQANVLDQNFVKYLRLCQLSIEYLLFCKKYLDNTVTLLKSEIKKQKEENLELSSFNDELKEHVSNLLKKMKDKETSKQSYKCDICLKQFASEEYLEAHKTRRHDTTENGNSRSEHDRINLELEVKELKQRLNTTERLIHSNEPKESLTKADTASFDLESKRKVEELQIKFESLKNQVEGQFKLIRNEREFEEKCSEWFQKALDNLKLLNSDVPRVFTSSATQTKAPDALKIVPVKADCGCQIDLRQPNKVEIASKPRRDSLTQTDDYLVTTNVTKVAPVVDNQIEPQETNVLPNLQEHISKIEENVANTLSQTLQKMEKQMQSICTEIQQIESKKSPVKTQKEVVKVVEKKLSPRARPRTSLTKQRKFEPMKRAKVVDKKAVPVKSATTVTTATVDDGGDSSELSDSSLRSVGIRKIQAKSVLKGKRALVKEKYSSSTLGRRSLSSLKRAVDEDLLKKFDAEMDNVVNNRLKEIGISPEWKALPQRSFKRAMELISHQADMTHKVHPEFYNIKEDLVKMVNQIARNENSPVRHERPKRHKKRSSKDKSYEFKPLQKSPKLEIKNRKLFESDSDEIPGLTQVKPHTKDNLLYPAPTKDNLLYSAHTKDNLLYSAPIKDNAPYSAPIKDNAPYSTPIKDNAPCSTPTKDNPPYAAPTKYSAVIQELKSFSTQRALELKSSSDSDTSKMATVGQKIEVQTKGVLKQYNTSGPSAKKRVLFDLEREPGDGEGRLRAKEGGSTTSVASSVLDASEILTETSQKKKDKKSEEVKDVESLSDFDYSEL